MTETNSKQVLLSAVVPMAKMSGRLTNFKSWVRACEKHSIEIIIVQDGLDNDTINEVQEVLRECSELKHKIITGRFGSAGNARNAGLHLASGKWIAFWDSDDQVLVDDFFKMVALAESRNLEVVLGKFEIVSEQDGKTFKPLGWEVEDIKVLARMPGLWRMAFKRDTICKTKFQELRVAEDQHFLVDIDFESRRYQWYGTTVYRYFMGGQGHVTQDSEALQDLLLATIRMGNKIRENGCEQLLSYLFLVRESISTIKYCPINSKISLIKRCLKFLFVSKSKEKKNLTKTLISIVYVEANLRFRRKFNSTTTIILCGGLGNQLFQTVAALVIAKSDEVRIETSFLSLEEKQSKASEIEKYILPPNSSIIHSEHLGKLTKKVISYCVRLSAVEAGVENWMIWRKFIRFIASLYFTFYYKKISILKINTGIGFSNVNRSRFNTILIGYFQSYRWHEQLSFVWPEQDFTLKQVPKIVEEFKALAWKEKPLVIHLRFGDYLAENTFGTLPSSYFQYAISKILNEKQNANIWVFSDDIEIAKTYFPLEMHPAIRWIGNIENLASTILEIMRLGESYIISNSTFGWWGAKLSKAKALTVYAPTPWFRFKTPPKEIIPPDWKTLPGWI